MKDYIYKRRTAASCLETKNNLISLNKETHSAYVGMCGPHTITLEDGTLLYWRVDRSKTAATPNSENSFMFRNSTAFEYNLTTMTPDRFSDSPAFEMIDLGIHTNEAPVTDRSL